MLKRILIAILSLTMFLGLACSSGPSKKKTKTGKAKTAKSTKKSRAASKKSRASKKTGSKKTTAGKSKKRVATAEVKKRAATKTTSGGTVKKSAPAAKKSSGTSATKKSTTGKADKKLPTKKQPAKTDSKKTEPKKVAPGKTEPAKKEPVKKEPVKKEPVKKEPVKKEAVKKEPVKKEPVKKEPVKKEIVKKEPTTVTRTEISGYESCTPQGFWDNIPPADFIGVHFDSSKPEMVVVLRSGITFKPACQDSAKLNLKLSYLRLYDKLASIVDPKKIVKIHHKDGLAWVMVRNVINLQKKKKALVINYSGFQMTLMFYTRKHLRRFARRLESHKDYNFKPPVAHDGDSH